MDSFERERNKRVLWLAVIVIIALVATILIQLIR